MLYIIIYSTIAYNTINLHFTLVEVFFHEFVKSLFELCKLVEFTTVCSENFHSLTEYCMKILFLCLLLSSYLLVSFEVLLLLYWMRQLIIAVFNCLFKPLIFIDLSTLSVISLPVCLFIYYLAVPYL